MVRSVIASWPCGVAIRGRKDHPCAATHAASLRSSPMTAGPVEVKSRWHDPHSMQETGRLNSPGHARIGIQRLDG